MWLLIRRSLVRAQVGEPPQAKMGTLAVPIFIPRLPPGSATLRSLGSDNRFFGQFHTPRFEPAYGMNFHLAHIVPSKLGHGLNGYKEVIDSIQWGLRELGHTADYGLNYLSSTATNIVFGAQILSEDVLLSLPSETIIYHLEQVRGQTLEELRPQARIAAERFHIWDYSPANALVWSQLGARSMRVVPIGYAPNLQVIPRPSLQDIDVLIYGSTSEGRLSALHFLSQSGLTTVFVCGLYGRARDDLIARSKLVVNISAIERSKIFEIVRVSYLLANRKAVVADVDADTVIDDDIRSAVKITTPPELVNDCLRLATDDAARQELEEAGFAIIEQRDIRKILEKALAPNGS
jgi:hypothetical protein